MTERTRNRTPEEAEAKARDEAFEAWNPGAPKPPEEPEETFKPPRQGIALPPSFLLILAGACALFALEPSADLGYELAGPGKAVDLGQPAAYKLDAARDGIRAHIKGYLGSMIYTKESFGDEHEVGVLQGTSVLVRRTRHPVAPADTVSIFEGEGRLVALDDTPSSMVQRMVDPSSRFVTLRLHYESFGELSKGAPAWLLLDGDIPRSQPWLIAKPLILWGLTLAFLFLAWRSQVARAAGAATRRRTWRT